MIIRHGDCNKFSWHFIEIGEDFPIEPTLRRLLTTAIKLSPIELICPYSYDTEELLTQNLCLSRAPSLRWVKNLRGVSAIWKVDEAYKLVTEIEDKLSQEALRRAQAVKLNSYVEILDGTCRGYRGRVYGGYSISRPRCAVHIYLRSRVIELYISKTALRVLPAPNCSECGPYPYWRCPHEKAF